MYHGHVGYADVALSTVLLREHILILKNYLQILTSSLGKHFETRDATSDTLNPSFLFFITSNTSEYLAPSFTLING